MHDRHNVFLIGATGAGKTSVGRRIAAHYALPFVDLDREIEDAAGTSIAMLFEHEGEAGFRAREAALLDACTARDGIVLATGAGAVLAAENRARLAARGRVLWLQVDPETQLRRLARDRSRPLLDHVDRRVRLREMAEIREPLYRALADFVVPEGKTSLAAAAAHCIALLEADVQPAVPASTRPQA